MNARGRSSFVPLEESSTVHQQQELVTGFEDMFYTRHSTTPAVEESCYCIDTAKHQLVTGLEKPAFTISVSSPVEETSISPTASTVEQRSVPTIDAKYSIPIVQQESFIDTAAAVYLGTSYFAYCSVNHFYNYTLQNIIYSTLSVDEALYPLLSNTVFRETNRHLVIKAISCTESH